MGKGRYIGSIPRQLSEEDKTFIKLIESGMKKAPAFRAAYPNHPSVIKWMDFKDKSGVDPATRQKLSELTVQAAKNKLQAKYMQGAIVTYQDSMEKFSQLSVETAIDLVENARSEKVRADLAIEGIRHKIGTPVTKVAVQEKKVVYLTFGNTNDEPTPLPQREVIDGEIVD